MSDRALERRLQEILDRLENSITTHEQMLIDDALRRIFRATPDESDFELLRGAWAEDMDEALLANASYISQHQQNGKPLLYCTHHLLGELILVPPGEEVPRRVWEHLDEMRRYRIPVDDWALAELFTPFVTGARADLLRAEHCRRPRPPEWLLSFYWPRVPPLEGEALSA